VPAVSDPNQPPIHLASLFLGPKAENAEAFERLLLGAFRDHVFWRRNFHPEDGFEISELTKRSPDYERAMSILSQELLGLLGELKGGVPFFSPRYIGHMTSDLTLASMVGYFATMLYNPNNVAVEGSPVTTRLELAVARDLATMIGYPADTTWGHLTSGGTIANFEAFWVARNVKYLPVAIAGAADELGLGDLPVERGDGSTRPIGELELWALLNVAPTATLDLADRLLAATDPERAADALSRHSLSRVGYQEYGRRLSLEFGDALPPAVVLCPSTAHYSWGKICRALGIGSDQLLHVPVDRHFRIDLDALWEILQRLAARRTPVLAAVAVAGTTEEGAIDRVDRVAEPRRPSSASPSRCTPTPPGAATRRRSPVTRTARRARSTRCAPTTRRRLGRARTSTRGSAASRRPIRSPSIRTSSASSPIPPAPCCSATAGCARWWRPTRRTSSRRRARPRWRPSAPTSSRGRSRAPRRPRCGCRTACCRSTPPPTAG
jgi:hypothetical protein